MQKESIQQLVAALPEEAEVDAAVEKLYLLKKLEVTEKRLANGKGISREDAKKRLEPWLE
ncbi:MAG: hypothetical protein ACYSWU_14045 [Planctomycetota bacterium]|jgi:hypothetical protein